MVWHQEPGADTQGVRGGGNIDPYTLNVFFRSICVARNLSLCTEPAVVPARGGVSCVGLKRPQRGNQSSNICTSRLPIKYRQKNNGSDSLVLPKGWILKPLKKNLHKTKKNN